MADAALIKAARQLDQRGPETVAAKLERLWTALEATRPQATAGGVVVAARFHAAEEVALRWILKSMHLTSGAAAEASKALRQDARAWQILGSLFVRIPPFSLGKALADRRFAMILQKSAEEMAAQKSEESYSAFFDALDTLVHLLDAIDQPDTPKHQRMGLLHIKSLFYLTAAEAMGLLVPLLQMCRDQGGRKQQKQQKQQWLDTVVTVWRLHMPGPTDAVEAGTHLAPFALAMLGREVHAGNREEHEKLKQFVLSSIVFPAYSDFVHRDGDVQTIAAALAPGAAVTGQGSKSFLARCGVLFRLALEAAKSTASLSTTTAKTKVGTHATMRKQNQNWVEAVLNQVRLAVDESKDPDAETTRRLVADLLEAAADAELPPTADGLALFCRHFGLPVLHDEHDRKRRRVEEVLPTPTTTTDWQLVKAVARCDVDVFLLDEGLLETTLEQLEKDDNDSNRNNAKEATALVVLLAQGFAKARGLPVFLKRWHDRLGKIDIDHPRGLTAVWLDGAVRAAVAAAMPGLTDTQLSTQLDALQSESTLANLVVYDALSAGLSGLIPLEQTAQTRLVDQMGTVEALPGDIRAIQWRLVQRTLPWVEMAEKERLWKTMRPLLKAVKGEKEEEKMKGKKGKKEKKGKKSLLQAEAFAAFTCCYAFAHFLSGKPQKKAQEWVCRFYRQLRRELVVKDKEHQKKLRTEIGRRLPYSPLDDRFGGDFHSETAARATYVVWMLYGIPGFVETMSVWMDSDDDDKDKEKDNNIVDELWEIDADAAATSLLGQSAAMREAKMAGYAVKRYVQQLESSGSDSGSDDKEAIFGLLQTPDDLLQRPVRERIAAALMPGELPRTRPVLPLDDLLLRLDLLCRVAQRPLHGAALDVEHLVWLGVLVLPTAQKMMLKPATRDDALAVFDRLRWIVQSSLQHALVSPERRQTVIQAVAGSLTADDNKDALRIDDEVRLVVLTGLFQAVAASASVVDPNLDPVRRQLALLVKKHIVVESSSDDDDVDMDAELTPTLAQYVAVDAAVLVDLTEDLPRLSSWSQLAPSLQTMRHLVLQREDEPRHWRAFVARYVAIQNEDDVLERQVAWNGESCAQIEAYLAAATSQSRPSELLGYVSAIVAALTPTTAVASLLAVRWLLGRVLGRGEEKSERSEGRKDERSEEKSEAKNERSEEKRSEENLGMLHMQLTQLLPTLRGPASWLAVQTLRTLLLRDKGAKAMGQANVEATLGAVAAAVVAYEDEMDEADETSETNEVSEVSEVSEGVKEETSEARRKEEARKEEETSEARRKEEARVKEFVGLCSLVEAVLQRHRLRLQGRFPLVVTTLQALLVHGVVPLAGLTTTTSNTIAPAIAWTRLVERICEPTASSVTVGGGSGSGSGNLSSAVATAKSYAGEHMYLVLLAYLKVQTDDHNTSHASLSRATRQTLQRAMASILSVTSAGVRQVVVHAVDESGRALYWDMYRYYVQYQKWRGQ